MSVVEFFKRHLCYADLNKAVLLYFDLMTQAECLPVLSPPPSRTFREVFSNLASTLPSIFQLARVFSTFSYSRRKENSAG